MFEKKINNNIMIIMQQIIIFLTRYRKKLNHFYFLKIFNFSNKTLLFLEFV